MKLLIYSHFFAPSIGGVENIVLSLAGGLQRRRDPQGVPEFDVTLVTQTPAGQLDDAVYPFRIARQPGLLRLWRIIRESDVIHLAGPALLPLALAFLARRPSVIEHHGYQAICPNGLLVHQPDRSICPGHFQAGNYLECWRCQRSEITRSRACLHLLLMSPRNWLSRNAAANIAVSHHVRKRDGLPNTSVVYHGIEDQQEPNSPSSGPGVLQFAYVGRFFREKGIAVLLHAAGLLRNQGCKFHLRLIGDGPQRPELEEFIQLNGLSSCVRITGYLTGAPLADALHDVRVVVMPSVWEETAGLAAIEQMMRGRLVIASKIGGLAEVVDDAGLTFPYGDVRGLVDTMKSVIKDPSLVDVLGRKARDRALFLFRRERMIQEHVRVYRDLFESLNT